jgi:L-aspartate oxidase
MAGSTDKTKSGAGKEPVPHDCIHFGEPRRYLVNIDSISTSQIFADCVVVGAGIAGLRAAIEMADHRTVILVCKGTLEDSNTWNAQGGVASVFNTDDTFESHIADTLKTGGGICDEKVVELVVRQGPGLIQELQQWGTAFDMANGHIDTTLEGGHSRARVVHAHGDETGRAIVEALIDKVKNSHNIRVIERFFAIDLLTDRDHLCLGIIGRHPQHGMQIIWAASTILATGGVGQLYRETTNPIGATADGLAMAYRAGAVLRDVEFVQFHPTTLYVAGASRALITETLRGEGGVLLDVKGRRFMKEYHEAGELAPRDVVSRAIVREMARTKAPCVYLDVRHIDRDRFSRRFPSIYEICRQFDIDVGTRLIPVRPSAHYMVGGLLVDTEARTTVPGLLACGEAACTGVHGANRLASNSLLEGLVYGAIAGRLAGETLARWSAQGHPSRINSVQSPSKRVQLDVEDIRNSLRSLMTRAVGIERDEGSLTEAVDSIAFWGRYVMDKTFDDRYEWESQNMLSVARLAALSARIRTESRGVHCRTDFPETDDAAWRLHITVRRGKDAPEMGTQPVDDAPESGAAEGAQTPRSAGSASL